jgi:hypothetical protein
MISVQQLRNTENFVKYPVSPRITDIRGGVWSPAEIDAALPGWPHVTTKSDQEVVFFTDDHLYGYQVLPSEFVSVSYRLPCFNMNQFDGPQDRDISSTTDLLQAYYKDRRVIQTVEELVAYVNKRYP